MKTCGEDLSVIKNISDIHLLSLLVHEFELHNNQVRNHISCFQASQCGHWHWRAAVMRHCMTHSESPLLMSALVRWQSIKAHFRKEHFIWMRRFLPMEGLLPHILSPSAVEQSPKLFFGFPRGSFHPGSKCFSRGFLFFCTCLNVGISLQKSITAEDTIC